MGRAAIGGMGRLGLVRALAIGFWVVFAVAPATAQLQPSVAHLAEELLDAVVSISTSHRVTTRDVAPIPDGAPGDNNSIQQILGLGSGFVIDPSGVIVTNNHVIEGADQVIAIFQDGSELRATVIGRDLATDIAVLRVHPPWPLIAVAFGPSEAVAVGDWVTAIGNPFGFGGTVTMGILSARDRDLNEGPYDNFLQTDAAITSTSGTAMGVAFAIPSETAARVVDHLVRFGEVRRGWLGVRIQELTAGLAEGLGLAEREGALVAQVMSASPAAEAGFQVGDIVISFDGQAIDEMRDLPRIVANTDIDREVQVVVLRGGVEITEIVTIGELEQNQAPPIAAQTVLAQPLDSVDAAALGLDLSPMSPAIRAEYNIDPSIEGMVITRLVSGSLASERRILEADIIVAIGLAVYGSPLATLAAVDAALAEELAAGRSSVVFLLARPDGVTRFEWISLAR